MTKSCFDLLLLYGSLSFFLFLSFSLLSNILSPVRVRRTSRSVPFLLCRIALAHARTPTCTRPRAPSCACMFPLYTFPCLRFPVFLHFFYGNMQKSVLKFWWLFQKCVPLHSLFGTPPEELGAGVPDCARRRWFIDILERDKHRPVRLFSEVARGRRQERRFLYEVTMR